MTSPVAAVRLPDPYPYYASLVAERPFAHDEGLGAWVASDAAAVTAALAHPALRVRPAAEPVPAGLAGTPAGDVYGDLVRMTDGPLQRRLKHVVTTALGRADTARVAALAADRARRSLAAGGRPRLGDLMFGVPARVVAALCGLDRGADEEAARLIGDFVRCLPATATPEDRRAAARAAARLQDALGPRLTRARARTGTGTGTRTGRELGSGPGPRPRTVPGAGPDGDLLAALVRAARDAGEPDTGRPLLSNAIGFLSQTYDATAGLIGNTLLALARGVAPAPGRPAALAPLVREVARYDAPVQNTRRFAAEPFAHAGVEVPPGGSVLVVLAAANRDPAVNPDPHAFRTDRARPALFTFGAAAHRCPGEDLAVAIAAAVVGELLAAGWEPSGLPERPAYRPLANARIPLL
ncbi:cytochrome P450 [Streptomyces sp. URMC 123]|uniref:cytochrome P450 n=1 Tax=Streptomyces sp. URMC 123 TaxID=3423403 RepID=UPI003F1ADD8F